jgi:N-acetylglucosamine-6-phosphate deacetylase
LPGDQTWTVPFDSPRMLSIDLQVNGYAGVDFNADRLNGDQLHAACEALRRDGTDCALATVITAEPSVMCQRIARLVGLRAEDRLIADVLVGIHVEGPFLSSQPGYIGAHPAEHAQAASPSVAERLLEAGDGLVRLLTLAPECDPRADVTDRLVRKGVRVAAGHTNASLEQLRQSIDGGLSMFTHLGNGCPAVLPRHDNIVQRVLSLREHLWISFIADGHHIPWFALANYLRTAGLERCIIVSDAMAAAGLGPGRYSLGDRWVDVDASGAAWSENRTHLVGSACSLGAARMLLQDQLGLSASQLDQLTNHQPRAVLGI